MPETMKLFGNTEKKTIKDKNDKKCTSFRDY